MNEPETIRSILKNTRTIAVVGLSSKPDRDSFQVSRSMQQAGYRILPVNPTITSVLGEKAYPSLEAACAAGDKVDLVNVFRAPQFLPEIVKEVIRLGIPYLWLQLGVCHEEATQLAEEAGVRVVVDRCIYREHTNQER